ncbi:hypothetical protein [Streptomyces werraensis]|uniref:hypothetical protein n=1 Tax=Streptomyces werraensis TaxID=68284 RepID=UPI0036FA4298
MARRVAAPGRAQGKRTTRFQKGGFTFQTDAGFESQILRSSGVRAVVEAETAQLAGKMIKEAPLGPHVHTDAYSIKKNIHPYVDTVGDEWVGFIVIEENPEARHAMLQERGYRDPAGKRHRGRFFLKKVLERERVQ